MFFVPCLVIEYSTERDVIEAMNDLWKSHKDVNEGRWSPVGARGSQAAADVGRTRKSGKVTSEGRRIFPLLACVRVPPWGNRTASCGPRSWTTWERTQSSPTMSCRSGTEVSWRTVPPATWRWRSSRRSTPTSSPTETPQSSQSTSSAPSTPTAMPPSTSGSSSSPWAWRLAEVWNRSCAGRSACTTWMGMATSAGRRCWRSFRWGCDSQLHVNSQQ